MINDLVVERSNLSEGSMTYHTTEKGKNYLEMYEESKVYDLTSNTTFRNELMRFFLFKIESLQMNFDG